MLTAIQVHYINPETFYGLDDNSNGESPFSYYLYPPPLLNSVGANDTGTISNTTT